ncbi:GntR family transcriptional regulator [Bacillus cereus]|uniref:GntR family transcriptional regulator n=1 Tax=Bacillus paramycoides TaxID=2026194 RepID=UPI000BF7A7FF|nr:GntR family transcriptional regulator [Bacillus paramycoides]PFD31473.1 GntR family transcriptional regulator [Bacillus cereus]PGM50245.1 GntR family transcriptional regulator [Bacillus cereus]
MKMIFRPNIPIYIQVMVYVKQEIVTGHLLPGDKILSVRKLANELEVHPNTIQHAFQELEHEGVVVTRRGNGRYVTNEKEKIIELKKNMMNHLLQSFMDGMINLGFTEAETFSIVQSFLEEKKEVSSITTIIK